jgi:hypothetical protein
MAQPQPATLNLVDDGSEDNRLRWFRAFAKPITVEKSSGVPLDMSGGDIAFSTFAAQIRKKDDAETLVCTGSVVFDATNGNGTGSDGKIMVTFPSSGWATTGEADCTCKWDLVGITSGNSVFQLIEGDADVLKTATEV